MENENVNNEITQSVIKNTKKFPNFFIDKNQIEINVYVVFNTLDGNILGVSTNSISNTFIQGIQQINYKFVFL